MQVVFQENFVILISKNNSIMMGIFKGRLVMGIYLNSDNEDFRESVRSEIYVDA